MTPTTQARTAPTSWTSPRATGVRADRSVSRPTPHWCSFICHRAGPRASANLGNSVALLEAVDFIRREAGECPVVINLSIEAHGGPHDGCTLVELGLDAFLTEAPGRCICQSTGNYFRTATHVSGVLRAGERRRFTWWTDAADVTPNELELWYSGQDRFVIELSAPQRDTIWRVPLGERAAIEVEDEIVGRIYHRAYEPNNGDHNALMFLYPVLACRRMARDRDRARGRQRTLRRVGRAGCDL